jgi:hypothetical protein
MMKKLEIEGWRTKAAHYRDLASVEPNQETRKMLAALAKEADSIADDAEEEQELAALRQQNPPSA